MPDSENIPSRDELLAAAPGVARIAGGSALTIAAWALETAKDTTDRITKAAASGEPISGVLTDLAGSFRDQAEELMGEIGVSDARSKPTPEEVAADVERRGMHQTQSLAERGRALLRQSADVGYSEAAHPAYTRILDELAPDEARILRLLEADGAQPSVDVRATSAIPTSSELIAPGITMIGSLAGCRYTDRVPAYLNNLFRLGLVWFSREPVDDVDRYQVLEAQPDVLEATASAKRSKTVRRSIHLTPFGYDFCRVCICGE